jgi:sugar phosphate isomerase/epimerase
MNLGIFSKIFVRPTLGEMLDAVRDLGITHVQFNAGSSDLSEAHCDAIRHEFDHRHLTLEVLSATFNIIHPDLHIRRQGLDRFTLLAQSAKHLGTSMLSVSTGTRDPEDMWRRHPENESADAWRDMLTAMSTLATVAEQHHVTIAFEPEQANIIDTACKARTLLDSLQSKQVKVLIDAANLLTVSNLPQQDRVLREAFDLLGGDIVLAHAKEFSADGKLGNAALGGGVVDFPLYISLLRNVGFQNSLIMHGFNEDAAVESMRHLAACR